MKPKVSLAFFGMLFWGCLVLTAGEEPHHHRILLSKYRGPGGCRLIEASAVGKLTWKHKVPSLWVIFQVLRDSHLVYGYGGAPTGVQEGARKGKEQTAFEITRDKQIARKFANHEIVRSATMVRFLDEE